MVRLVDENGNYKMKKPCSWWVVERYVGMWEEECQFDTYEEALEEYKWWKKVAPKEKVRIVEEQGFIIFQR